MGRQTGETVPMLVVHGTKKFLDRVGHDHGADDVLTTMLLGPWYATVLLWRPQLALFVNEATLLPVFMPLAPAAKVLDRLPAALEEVLLAHGLDAWFIDSEIGEMAEHVAVKTRNRSVVGIMNEFTFLGEVHRDAEPKLDLTALSVRLARTPCSPLYGRHVSPDRELAALVAATGP
jgi:hypothetical protein